MLLVGSTRSRSEAKLIQTANAIAASVVQHMRDNSSAS